MIDKDSDNHNTVTSNQSPLWQRILAFSLDQAGTEIPFSRRVARENGWSTDYTQCVIEEYKRFAFLATVAGHLVTPSDPVDQVWHLHLTYSGSYWEDFCPHVLGKVLHHDPTRGGWAEQDKFREWYHQTLASYERLLGHAAPADIWPAPEIRFCGDAQFVRINRADYWIVPKPGAQTIAPTDRTTTNAQESGRCEPTVAIPNNAYVTPVSGCVGCGGCGGCGG